MNGQKLEEVTSFKYLGATLCKNGTYSVEVRIRIASAMARLNKIWRCNTICFASKFKPYKCCGCETWTLLADSEKRSQAFETRCLIKLLRTSFLEHKTNDTVQSKISFLVGPQEPFLATVKR